MEFIVYLIIGFAVSLILLSLNTSKKKIHRYEVNPTPIVIIIIGLIMILWLPLLVIKVIEFCVFKYYNILYTKEQKEDFWVF